MATSSRRRPIWASAASPTRPRWVATADTSTATLAESATNTAYTLSVVASDALGNAATAITKNLWCRPYGSRRWLSSAALPNNAQLAAFTGVNYTLAATDNATAPAAPSAFFNLGATPLQTSQNRRDVVNGSFFWCPNLVAYQKSTTACPNTIGNGWSTGTTNYASNLNFSEYNASAVDAYYTATSTVADQAGNISNAASRVELVDATAPAIGGLSYPPFLVAGGSATFSSTTQDNLDIQLERLNLRATARFSRASRVPLRRRCSTRTRRRLSRRPPRWAARPSGILTRS